MRLNQSIAFMFTKYFLRAALIWIGVLAVSMLVMVRPVFAEGIISITSGSVEVTAGSYLTAYLPSSGMPQISLVVPSGLSLFSSLGTAVNYVSNLSRTSMGAYNNANSYCINYSSGLFRCFIKDAGDNNVANMFVPYVTITVCPTGSSGTLPTCTCNTGFAPNSTATACVESVCVHPAGEVFELVFVGAGEKEYDGCGVTGGTNCVTIILSDGYERTLCDFESTGNPPTAAALEGLMPNFQTPGYGTGACLRECVDSVITATTAAITAVMDDNFGTAINTFDSTGVRTAQQALAQQMAAMAAEAAALEPNATVETVQSAALSAATSVMDDPAFNTAQDAALLASIDTTVDNAVTAAATTAGASPAATATLQSLTNIEPSVITAITAATAAAGAAADAANAAAAAAAAAAGAADAAAAAASAAGAGDGSAYGESGVSAVGLLSGISASVNATSGVLGGIGSGFESDKNSYDWFNFTMPLAPVACTPFTRSVLGISLSIDLCIYVEMLRSLLAWLLGIFTIWHVFGVITRGNA